MPAMRGDVKVTAVTDELEVTTEGKAIHYKRIFFVVKDQIQDSVRLTYAEFLNAATRNAAIMEQAHADADTLDFQG